MLIISKFLISLICSLITLSSVYSQDISTTPSDQVISQITPVTDDDKSKYDQAVNITCTSQNCQLPYGTCMSDSICKCLDNYANVIIEGEEQKGYTLYCAYKRYNQLLPFLLELFLPCVGHFVVGNIGLGIGKLLLAVGLCCTAAFFAAAKGKGGSNAFAVCLGVFTCLMALGDCGWYIADLVLYGTNSYTDGNGVPLKGW